MLEVTPHLRSTCDRMLELPIVMKHVGCLPEHLEDHEEKSDDRLLQTIKLSLDSKDKLSIMMPKPRYASTIQHSERVYLKKGAEEEERDFHNISLKK